MCYECWKEARVVTYLYYYEVLGTRARAGSPHKQVTGHLRPTTTALCLKCFLKLAAKRGSSRAEIQKLRQRFKLPEKGSSSKTADKRVSRMK
jgi:hypothetical protein